MATTLTIQPESVPLHLDDAGCYRVGGTRVSLELIVAAFEQGATAEEIVQRYPTLGLADVYGVIAFFLRHQDEVNAYVARRDEEQAALRVEIEAQPANQALRRRLLERKRQGLT